MGEALGVCAEDPLSPLRADDVPSSDRSLCHVILERLAEGLVLLSETGHIQE